MKKSLPTLSPPSFSSFDDERRYRKERLAGAFRLFSKCGFDEGTAGHITVRDPEFPHLFWVNPYGVHFSQIRMSDLLLINHNGEIVQGNGLLNTAAFMIHSRLHAARPGVVAAAHAHSLYGKAWSSLGRLLEPITQDSCVFYENHALYNDYRGIVLDTDEGDRIAEALGDKKAVILQNHGLLTVGESVDEAAWLFITMERSCQAQLLAESAGKPKLIDKEIAKETSLEEGAPDACWFSFQPTWSRLISETTDFIDE